MATFIFVLSTLFAVPWSERKYFIQDIRKIEIGMHETKVLDLLQTWSLKKTVGSDSSPDLIAVQNRPGRFGSDIFLITLGELGKVQETEFLPD